MIRARHWSLCWSVMLCCHFAGHRAGAEALSVTPRYDFWGIGGEVSTIETTSQRAYLSGRVNLAGPIVGPFAQFDATLNAMPPFARIRGVVYAVVADGAGGWYVGGDFSGAANTPRSNLAHFLPDGSLDLSWAPETNDPVRALAYADGVVYAGGEFSRVSGAERSYLAAIDGVTGVTTDLSANTNGEVYALALSGEDLFVGGFFSSIDRVNRRAIAMLNRSTMALRAWNPVSEGAVYALAVSGTTLYVGGDFEYIGGEDAQNLAALSTTGTGASLAWFPNPNGIVRALAVSGDILFAGGEFTRVEDQPRRRLAALDVTKTEGIVRDWAPDPDASVRALAIAGNALYAGGYFRSIAASPRRHLAKFDLGTPGVPLTDADAGLNNDVRSLATAGDTIAVGGDFYLANAVERYDVAAIDLVTGEATGWIPDASAGSFHTLEIFGETVYIGGEYMTIDGVVRDGLAAVDAESGALTAWNPNVLGSVLDVEVSADTVYLAGTFNTVGEVARPRLAAVSRKTGRLLKAWDAQVEGGEVSAILLAGDTLYLAGYFTSVGGELRNLVAAVDAYTGAVEAWNPSPSREVKTLADAGDFIYLGGRIGTIGGVTHNRLARVSPTSGIASPFLADFGTHTDGVISLAMADGRLIAAGQIVGEEGRNSRGIVAVDPQTGGVESWDPAFNNDIKAMSVSGNHLCVGGVLQSIGNVASSCFVVLDVADTTGPNARYIVPTNASPSSSETIVFTVSFDENVVNFDSSAVEVVHVGTMSGAVTVSGGPTNFAVSIAGVTGTGTLQMQVSSAGLVADAAGNPLASSVSGVAQIDASVPGVPIEDELHSADQDHNYQISLSELLRSIQFYNLAGIHCATNTGDTEDGFRPGQGQDLSCIPHDADYNPQDWQISLSELLRLIQFYNAGAFHPCAGELTEDAFCPGIG